MFFPFQIQKDLQYVKEDLNVVERQRIDSCRARNRSSPKLRMSTDDFITTRSWSSSVEKKINSSISSSQNSPGGMSTWNFLSTNMVGKTQASKLGPHKKDNMSLTNPQHTSQLGLSVVRKKRVHSQVSFFFTQINGINQCIFNNQSECRVGTLPADYLVVLQFLVTITVLRILTLKVR